MFILAYADIIIPGEPKMMCRDEIIIALKEYKILPLIIIIGSKNVLFHVCNVINKCWNRQNNWFLVHYILAKLLLKLFKWSKNLSHSRFYMYSDISISLIYLHLIT